ncbi:MAG TPA: hypothetical protein VLT33_51780 [Labilithrix sp.]|nr:hypothetical protein [Labilithrix sp.]
MKALLSSPWSRVGLSSLVALYAVASCGGIQERLEVLRAERVEIVDERGVVKMDLEKQIRALEERVQKLETALDARRREEAAPPRAPASAAVSAAATPTADASVAPARGAGPAATPGVRRAPPASSVAPPDVF